MTGSQTISSSIKNASDFHGLVPTRENLDLLRDIDLSSFSESQNTRCDSDSFSDDPFGSQDLVGLCETSDEIKQEAASTKEQFSLPDTCQKRGTALPSSPLFVTANSSPQVSPAKSQARSVPNSTIRVKKEPISILSSSHQTSSSHLPSPSRKRVKIEPQTRNLSTSAQFPDEEGHSMNPGTASTSEGPELYDFGPPRRGNTAFANMSNPTIQLATQKPAFSPWDQDPRGSQALAGVAKRVTPFILSREQRYVMDLVLQGESLFFTGSAGTGKSVLLKKIIKSLKEQYRLGEIAVTASTGLAAHHIGGITVHSFAGIGLGKGSLESIVKQVRRNRKVVSRWKDTKVLIIDEISMIDGRLLDIIDQVARKIRRKNHLPFGGIQLVLTGDFFQLPPVSKISFNSEGEEIKDDALYAFESQAWKECIKTSIILEEVFRQKGDQKFIEMLNDMRNGVVTPESEAEFARLSRPLNCPAGIVPAELYATRSEVDQANNLQLSRLEGEAYLYEAIDGGELPPKIKSALLANFLAPPRLHLKKGAQVMCLKNFDEGLINGSIGKVIDFLDRDVYMGRTLMKEKPFLPYEEYRKELLKKNVEVPDSSQASGPSTATESKKETILDHVFDFFNEDKKALNLKEEADECQANETKLSPEEQNRLRKLRLIERLEKSSKKTKYPLVRFTNSDNVTTRDVLVEPEWWEHLGENNEVLVSRLQLPLMLAWALSIHKSQGLTLSHVKVNLGRIFEYGQAYVALSRAVSRDSLQVTNFRRDRIRSSMIVKDFYKTLVSAGEHRKGCN